MNETLAYLWNAFSSERIYKKALTAKSLFALNDICSSRHVFCKMFMSYFVVNLILYFTVKTNAYQNLIKLVFSLI